MSSGTAFALIAGGDQQGARHRRYSVAQAGPREHSARLDATFVALATVTTSAVAPPATLTGPTFVAGSASALRAIGRAITPLQVSAAGATDFTFVSKRTAS
jgi:hypothetical protein